MHAEPTPTIRLAAVSSAEARTPGTATGSIPQVTGGHVTTLPGESGFREGMRIASVVCLGFIVMGIGLGVLVGSVELPWWVALVLSAVVFAGSVEFLLVGMIASSAPLSLIASSTLILNARHLVYGISYPLHRVRGPLAKTLAIYMLCDEAYALNTGPKSDTYRGSRIMTISVALWVSWWLGSLLGTLLGATFLSELEGVDFVMTGMFVILALESYREVRDKVTAALALVAALAAVFFFPESMLLVALLTLVVMLIIRHLLIHRSKPEPTQEGTRA